MSAFDKALEAFRAAVEATIRAHYKRQGYVFAVPSVRIGSRGTRYVKLLSTSGGSVHSFVEIKTGDIFKPASWRTPAKHARGSIYVDEGRPSLTPHGDICYLR